MLVDSLSANFLPYNTKDGEMKVQLAVRPIYLYELVFPKECLPNVLKGIGYSPENDPKLKLHRAVMRKILMADKIPEVDLKDVNPIMVNAPFCAIYPIGIKEDGVYGKEPFPHLEGSELL